MSLKTMFQLTAFLMLWAVSANAGGWYRSSAGPTSNAGGVEDSSVFPALSSATAITSLMNPADGPIILYAIHTSSGVAQNYVTVFDDVSNLATSTATVVQVMFESTTTGTRVQFNPPLRIYNGLTVRASGCQSSKTDPWCYTVFYDEVDE